MKVLDLFSGIGGFSLGLERAGMETVGFCEIDSFCRKVLQKHWPDVPIFEDIKELDGDEYRGTVDLICGGFPCQPFSVAGKQRGSGDDRALWPEMLRVIREVEPTWVIGENVPGIINMELDTVLSDLEDSGYSCQTFNIPACSLDAQHIRARIFFISHTNSATLRDGTERGAQGRDHFQRSGNAIPAHDGPSQSMAHTDNRHWSREIKEVLGKQSGETSDRSAGSGEAMADTDSQRPQGRQTFGDSQGVREGSDEQFKRCFDSSSSTVWEPEPGVGRVAHGVPNRVDRLRGLGNAVVPQVAELIGRMILGARRT
jgi:DNA (cytosine-5)-methyltransferase 1